MKNENTNLNDMLNWAKEGCGELKKIEPEKDYVDIPNIDEKTGEIKYNTRLILLAKDVVLPAEPEKAGPKLFNPETEVKTTIYAPIDIDVKKLNEYYKRIKEAPFETTITYTDVMTFTAPKEEPLHPRDFGVVSDNDKELPKLYTEEQMLEIKREAYYQGIKEYKEWLSWNSGSVDKEPVEKQPTLQEQLADVSTELDQRIRITIYPDGGGSIAVLFHRESLMFDHYGNGNGLDEAIEELKRRCNE